MAEGMGGLPPLLAVVHGRSTTTKNIWNADTSGDRVRPIGSCGATSGGVVGGSEGIAGASEHNVFVRVMLLHQCVALIELGRLRGPVEAVNEVGRGNRGGAGSICEVSRVRQSIALPHSRATSSRSRSRKYGSRLGRRGRHYEEDWFRNVG